MKWATRELIHFDRIASAWLILRFIDPDATFVYLKEGECAGDVERPGDAERAGDDVKPFGVPGVRLAIHDGQSTTFARILEAYSISGAAIETLSEIITEGVRHVMHDVFRSDLSKRTPLTAGALALTEGIFITSATDQECLERCLPLYDALYARLQAQVALNQNNNFCHQSVLNQTVAIANATRELRQRQCRYSDAAFAEMLADTSPASTG
jgi:hypothetical protein